MMQTMFAALRGILGEIGYADALLARRDGEGLVLIDGHLRRSLDPDQLVPVVLSEWLTTMSFVRQPRRNRQSVQAT